MLVLVTFSLKTEDGISFVWLVGFSGPNSTVSEGIFLQNSYFMFAFNLMSVVFFHLLFIHVIGYLIVKDLPVALFPYKML